MSKINFSELRAQWALKHTPSVNTINLQHSIDQRANPYNEPYHNKAPRRSEAQIVSDLCYEFADDVLKQQYGKAYTDWLEAVSDMDRFTRVHKERD